MISFEFHFQQYIQPVPIAVVKHQRVLVKKIVVVETGTWVIDYHHETWRLLALAYKSRGFLDF